MRTTSSTPKPAVRIRGPALETAPQWGGHAGPRIGAATAPACTLSPTLCREARTLLDLEESELAFVARMPLAMLQDYERGASEPPASALAILQRALERAGVVFTPEEGGRGVRLR